MAKTPPVPALALVIVGVFASEASAQRKNPDAAAVLMLSGGQREHHGYREQALYLSRLLEDTGRLRVTICEDAAILETPSLAKYDVLMITADRRDPEFKMTEGQQRAVFAFVKSGKGFVTLHGGDNAPPDWLPEWKEMLGGIFSHVGQPDGKAVSGTFTVKIVDKAHPITRGIDDYSNKDELYSNVQMKPDVKPLATIDYKGTEWPVAWTYAYGAGRVFHCSLGHCGWKPGSEDPLRFPNLGKLVVQGTEWAAGDAGKPAASGSKSEG